MSNTNKPLVSEFSFTITKATYDKVTDERRWAGTLSDTAKDVFDEKMSLQLFQEFITHVTQNDPIPEPFQTEYYKGGMPYVSLSHYPDLNGKAVLGKTTDLYIDGKMLKAKGNFEDTPLGRAAFNAVCKSLYDTTEKDKKPVRLSIGFLDMGHVHGDKEFIRHSLKDVCPMCLDNIGDKEYRSGYLVHEALTRVPANPRTEIVAEVTKMADIKTQLEDAVSIVGEELAAGVDKENTMVGKSEALVIKSEDVPPEAHSVTVDANGVVLATSGSIPEEKKDAPVDMSEVDEHPQEVVTPTPVWAVGMTNMLKQVLEKVTPVTPVSQKSAVEKVVQNDTVSTPSHPLSSVTAELMSIYDNTCANKNLDNTQKLKVIQDAYSKLGGEIQRTVTEIPEVLQSESTTEVKSSVMIAEAVSKAVSEKLQPLVDQVSLITQQMGTIQGTKSVVSSIPQRRSIDPTLVQQQQSQVSRPKSETPRLHDIIQRSLGPQ